MQTFKPKLHEVDVPTHPWITLHADANKGNFALTTEGTLLISNGDVWVCIRPLSGEMGDSFETLHSNARIVTVLDINYTL